MIRKPAFFFLFQLSKLTRNELDIFPFKERTIDFAKPVRVYRNLNDRTGDRRYSIWQNGFVVGHANAINLMGGKFKVQQGGRARVLRDKKKNVHAWVTGLICQSAIMVSNNRVSYNPYTDESFKCGEEPVSILHYLHISEKGVFAGMNAE